ncbi:DUF1045 domain-containing protein [Roseovarius sp. S4756]|uniref:DUF1045 domain-containing protein n=1 Tax=Roseovarius maritimus TaxID=3342637 RepID=UPI00372BBEE1
MPSGPYLRYAIYWTPAPGPLASFGAHWLGWDPACGSERSHPPAEDLPVAQITARPRKYGLHATIKAPFRLVEDQTFEGLRGALDSFAGQCAPIQLESLGLARLGRFLCLRPEGDTTALTALAAGTVRQLDAFRAPLTEAEIARRRHGRLSPEADALLLRWGYPHVMEQFRFHVTLTGPLDDDMAARTRRVLTPLLDPLLPRPFAIDALTLMGEDADGRFHALHRAPLTNSTG